LYVQKYWTLEFGSSEASPGFVFGQDMENRVVKTADEKDEEHEQGESGAQSTSGQAPSLLRPSAFKSSGLLAPSRLGSNPFVSSSPNVNSKASHESGYSSNPFAAISNPHSSVSLANSNSNNNSDSEDSSSNMISRPKFTLTPSRLDKQTSGFSNTGFLGNPVAASYKSSFVLEPAKLLSPLSRENGKEGESAASGEARVSGAAGGADAGECSTSPPNNTHAGTAEEKEASTFSDETKNTFGQNLNDRVANANGSNTPSCSFVFGSNMGERGTSSATPSKSSDDLDLLDDKSKSPTDSLGSPTQTLAQSASAHMAKCSKSQIEVQEVEVLTGEENESNVFQFNARLFAFDKERQSWAERGRGLLRLNDMCSNDPSNFQSRLVMRTTGILKLVLNTRIWPGMMVDRASPKSIRISAICPEDGTAKMFLIMANPKDADQIFSAIDWRVQQVKQQSPKDAPIHSTAHLPTSFPPLDSTSPTNTKKRAPDECTDDTTPVKKSRVDPEHQREESTDSSTLDPETEASNESGSSPIKSSSSE